MQVCFACIYIIVLVVLMASSLCTGTPETLLFNMSKLGWSVLTSVKERDPLASEVSILCLFQPTLL